MKLLILLLIVFFPIREVEDVKLSLPTKQYDIFVDHSNDNFSQKLMFQNDVLTAEIKSSNFLNLDLNFRVYPDTEYISSLNPEVQKVIWRLFESDRALRSYLNNVSLFFKEKMQYTDINIPQDATAVILSKKGKCIGFANAATVMFKAAGIQNKVVKGFYLKSGRKNIMIPIPHQWVEIHLPNNVEFFYDPQYQRFSANYIATRDDVDFKQVKKFKVYVIKKSKNILN